MLNDCKIEQIGTPMEVYTYPATRFVAGFIGSPAMNYLKAEISASGDNTAATLGDGSRIALTIAAPGAGRYEPGIWPESERVSVGSGDMSV